MYLAWFCNQNWPNQQVITVPVNKKPFTVTPFSRRLLVKTNHDFNLKSVALVYIERATRICIFVLDFANSIGLLRMPLNLDEERFPRFIFSILIILRHRFWSAFQDFWDSWIAKKLAKYDSISVYAISCYLVIYSQTKFRLRICREIRSPRHHCEKHQHK